MLPVPPVGIEDDSRSAGAPGQEIEITPAMVEAGAEVIWAALDGVVAYGSDTGRMWARLVFEAMAKQSLNASKLTVHRCLSSLFSHDIG
jgi:hypothetical protein